MDYLPIYLDVRNKDIAVIGGTTSAARKAEMALRSNANITVFAKSLGDDFLDICEHPNFHHEAREFTPADITGCVVVYGASANYAENERLCEIAKAAKVPVNIADTTELCDFIMPAVLDRDPLVVTISSGGTSPILARVIKTHLETAIPATFGRLARLVGKYRDLVKGRITTDGGRRRFWEAVIDGPVADLLHAGDEPEAENRLGVELDSFVNDGERKLQGEVYLIGAGPGDPDLLTFRALRLIQRADVILYDRLIGKGVLNLVRRDAERIYVGKRLKDHAMQQEEISQLLVDLARQGKRVVRLKGGDPFIFGRGGEEIELLAESGITFQVVPGITAASGCATYSGIPLTHRDHAQACIFVTGHGKDDKFDLNWSAILQPNQTVVIYMGTHMLEKLVAEFVARGTDLQMPVAVIENCTRRAQIIVTGTLDDIAGKAQAEGIRGPALIIIGSVVSLREKLKWYNPNRKLVTGNEPDAIPDQP
jgi:uroporphyrin-III C-methyltransferase/precorrin-2 dehydrogenase/sirohydrochlorin ferrochelatase